MVQLQARGPILACKLDFWPANNYGDWRDYDRVAMRPENSEHVRNAGVLSRDNMAVRKFAQM